jgi:2-pyrone-4,6-dicarboxylate lactonase
LSIPAAPSKEPPTIAGPVESSSRPAFRAPALACDSHAHLFGPASQFPFTEGRGYTPPEAPLERYLQLLDRLGLDRGVIVQGNAHGYDNRVILNALEREPTRLRGVAITDDRVSATELREWHRLGMRGLRFHVHAESNRPNYVRGVGLDMLDHFLPMLCELGWIAQLLCDWRALPQIKDRLAELGRRLPVVLDHLSCMPTTAGMADPSFQTLLSLVGEGRVYAKLSAPYRQSSDTNRYEDVRPLHQALVSSNPERLLWGSDWPHTQTEATQMPSDERLLDLFDEWVPSAADRQQILVNTPQTLFWA